MSDALELSKTMVAESQEPSGEGWMDIHNSREPPISKGRNSSDGEEEEGDHVGGENSSWVIK